MAQAQVTRRGRRGGRAGGPSVPAMTKTISLAGLGLAVLAFVLSDVVNRGYDPIAETISRYVNLPHGWLVTAGLLAVAAGSAAVAAGAGGGRGRWLLWIWAGCVAVAAVFPADPPGNWDDPSLSETVHGVAAWAGFLALAVAIVRLTAVRRAQSPAPGLTVLAWGSSVAFVLFAVAMADAMAFTHTAPLGLAERVLIALDLAWLALLAASPKPSGTMNP
jgi:hypothetical protein